MLVKASILATALIAVTVGLSSVDFRELYNEMYPVNGLKRGVLGLCREAKPSFVRALRSDRENCYDSMPDPVELAIGWTRTSSRLAELNKMPSSIELAERILDEAAVQRRLGAPLPLFSGYVQTPAAPRPCTEAKAIATFADDNDLKAPSNNRLASDRLARRIAGTDEATLAALGLSPRGAKPGVVRYQELPIMPLNGAAAPTASQTAASGCKTPI
jgi:hypothetical protein